VGVDENGGCRVTVAGNEVGEWIACTKAVVEGVERDRLHHSANVRRAHEEASGRANGGARDEVDRGCQAAVAAVPVKRGGTVECLQIRSDMCQYWCTHGVGTSARNAFLEADAIGRDLGEGGWLGVVAPAGTRVPVDVREAIAIAAGGLCKVNVCSRPGKGRREGRQGARGKAGREGGKRWRLTRHVFWSTKPAMNEPTGRPSGPTQPVKAYSAATDWARRLMAAKRVTA
jgi:hypothetical protein